MHEGWVRYYGLLINRREVERELEGLIGEKGTEATAVALEAIRIVRSTPDQPMSARQASEYAAESEYAERRELPEPTPGVHDWRCGQLMPLCLCLRCGRDHSDGVRICCAEHKHKCKEEQCPDYLPGKKERE